MSIEVIVVDGKKARKEPGFLKLFEIFKEHGRVDIMEKLKVFI